MILIGPATAARIAARSCARKMPGLVAASRSARTPRNGLASGAIGRYGIGLSPPTSSSRMVTGYGVERLGGGAVGGDLLILGWLGGALEEQELGAEQAHAVGAQLHGAGRLPGSTDVREQGDLDAVAGHRRQRRLAPRLRVRAPGALGPHFELTGGGGIGVEKDLAGPAVDRHLAGAERREEPLHAHDGRDAVGTRQDGGVGGGRPGLEREPEEPLAGECRGHRRGQVLGHDDARHLQVRRCGVGDPGGTPGDPHRDIADVSRAGREELVAETAELVGQVAARAEDGADGIDVSFLDGLLRQGRQDRVECHLRLGAEDGTLVGVPVGSDAIGQCLELGRRGLGGRG